MYPFYRQPGQCPTLSGPLEVLHDRPGSLDPRTEEDTNSTGVHGGVTKGPRDPVTPEYSVYPLTPGLHPSSEDTTLPPTPFPVLVYHEVFVSSPVSGAGTEDRGFWNSVP